LPGLLGCAAGVAVGFAVYAGGERVPLGPLIAAFTATFLLVGAGQCVLSVGTLQQSGALGKFNTYPSRRPWWNRPLFDAARCCSDSASPFFSVLRALFGYQDRPTAGELLAYAGYWAAAFFAFRRRREAAAAALGGVPKSDSPAASAAEATEQRCASGNPELEGDAEGLLAGQQGRSSSSGAL